MKLAIPAVTVALLALLAGATPARSDCPFNLVWAGCGSTVGYVVATPGYGYDEYVWSAGQACQRACYDLANGRLVARAAGGAGVGPGCTSGIQLTDTYRVVGLPAGTVHEFTAELHIATTTPEPTALSARIAAPGNGTESALDVLTAEPAATRILAIALTKLEGEPFDLDVDLTLVARSASMQTSVADARIYFRGLPSGVQVTSCQRYSVPVPARAASWGEVKSLYR